MRDLGDPETTQQKTRPDPSPPGVPFSPARVFTDRILREKVNYQFTRALSLRAIVDYSIVNRDSTLSRVDPQHRWGVDLLFTYLVNPGTALYVGYRVASTDVMPQWNPGDEFAPARTSALAAAAKAGR